MPSNIRNNLNQVIRADLTAAEVNNLLQRPFAGLAITDPTNETLISGLHCSIVADAADLANVRGFVMIQQGLTLTLNTAFPATEKADEMILHNCFYQGESGGRLIYTPSFVPPIPLASGRTHSIVLTAPPRAPLANGVILLLTVFGHPSSGGSRPRARSLSR